MPNFCDFISFTFRFKLGRQIKASSKITANCRHSFFAQYPDSFGAPFQHVVKLTFPSSNRCLFNFPSGLAHNATLLK